MAAHIGQDAAAKIPPPAPIEVQMRGMIRPIRSRAEPEIVIEARRRCGRGLGQVARSRPALTPDLNPTYFADRAGLNQLHDPAIVVARVDLCAHLGDELV